MYITQGWDLHIFSFVAKVLDISNYQHKYFKINYCPHDFWLCSGHLLWHVLDTCHVWEFFRYWEWSEREGTDTLPGGGGALHGHHSKQLQDHLRHQQRPWQSSWSVIEALSNLTLRTVGIYVDISPTDSIQLSHKWIIIDNSRLYVRCERRHYSGPFNSERQHESSYWRRERLQGQADLLHRSQYKMGHYHW